MVLLAAGRGSRLGELTADRPKALVPLLGRPLLTWLLHTISTAGIDNLTIVTGYRADTLDEFGLQTVHNAQWANTNMVASLLCARDILRQSRTIISYTDIVYDADDLKRFATLEDPISLAYDPNWQDLWSRRFPRPLDDAETFAINASGQITDIGDRPTHFNQVRGQYMGLLNINPEAWQSVESVIASLDPETVTNLDMTSLLSRCIREHNISVRGFPIASSWCEIDSPSDIPIAESILRDWKERRRGQSMSLSE